MVPRTGPTVRRARHLIPAGLPRRGEVVAGGAVAIVVAHLLLAQLTLVLAVGFAVTGKVSRWRLSWLLAPAAAGLAWTLAIGPDKALAGFAAGPAGILWHLGGGHRAGEAGQPFAGLGGIRGWLPRQFPVALLAGAAEAALAGWLDWLHTDEWAVPPPRPGLIAAARRAVAAHRIRSGAVVTRDGCALGVAASTGAAVELRWEELARGALVVGYAQQDVTLTGLQVVHAALRRRKPVIVLDPGDAALADAVAAACQATGTPLLRHNGPDGPDGPDVAGHAETLAGGGAGSASRLWGRGLARDVTAPPPGGPARPAGPPAAGPVALAGRAGVAAPVIADPAGRPPVDLARDLARVARDRLAALLPADRAELAGGACAALTSLAASLRRIGVDGDALVWVPRGELVPARALTALLRDSADAGLSVLIGTTSPPAAAELSGLAGTVLVYRLADRALADRLAARAGTRLLPAPVAAALAARRPDESRWPAAAPVTAGHAGFPVPPSVAPLTDLPAGPPDAPLTVPPAVTAAAAPGLVPGPVIPGAALLTLGQGEFVLAVSAPRPRRAGAGLLVPARLAGRPG